MRSSNRYYRSVAQLHFLVPQRIPISFTSFRREMDRLFDDFTRGWAAPATFATGLLSPKVNVAETDKGLEITADLPGIDQKDIEISLTDDILTLKAEHKAEKEEEDEKKQYHLVERSFGTFMRRFELPFEADTDQVEASFDKGVLKIWGHVPHCGGAGQKIPIKGR